MFDVREQGHAKRIVVHLGLDEVSASLAHAQVTKEFQGDSINQGKSHMLGRAYPTTPNLFTLHMYLEVIKSSLQQTFTRMVRLYERELVGRYNLKS